MSRSKPKLTIEFRNRAEFNFFLNWASKGIPNSVKQTVIEEVANTVTNPNRPITEADLLKLGGTFKTRFKDLEAGGMRTAAEHVSKVLNLMAEIPLKYKNYKNTISRPTGRPWRSSPIPD